jgi:hypothetical protein
VTCRVYLPATLDLLREWAEAAVIPAGAERFVADDDSEEAEYDALLAAADASAALVGAPGRRVVVVADLPEPDAETPWRLVAAVHADPADVDTSAPEHLDVPAWFAVQEVPALLG